MYKVTTHYSDNTFTECYMTKEYISDFIDCSYFFEDDIKGFFIEVVENEKDM